MISSSSKFFLTCLVGRAQKRVSILPVGVSFPPCCTVKQVCGDSKTHQKRESRISKPLPIYSEDANLIAPLQKLVEEQNDLLHTLKTGGADDLKVKAAVEELVFRERALEDKKHFLANQKNDQVKLHSLLNQRFFFDQSFSIYGGVSGLYDLGPTGCAVKNNLLAAWREFFIVEEDMLEVECSTLTPEQVLDASGHLSRFTDTMVRDIETGQCFRADHLIKAHIETCLSNEGSSLDTVEQMKGTLSKIDTLRPEEMHSIMQEYAIKSPITQNELSEPMHFNLMFGTFIGPTGALKGHLRPETAQGIFVNFKRLLDFNAGKLPFAAAQIGLAFRNEIAPKSGLLRTREFMMAEIEHFSDPAEKNHPKFGEIENVVLPLFTACDQVEEKPLRRLTMKQAVEEGLVNSQTLAYFLARIHLFLLMVGADEKKIRFRQHMSNEMAHYAKDCWDAELKTSYGWVECVGCADRSCYDLQQHSKATGVRLSAERKLDKPKVIGNQAVPNAPVIGKVFKQNAKLVRTHLENMNSKEAAALEQALTENGLVELMIDGHVFPLTPKLVRVKPKEIHIEEVLPSVVEPSFGIGRVMYSIFEHNFRTRDGDEQRTYLSLPPVVSPYKCSVLPLMKKPEFDPLVTQISQSFKKMGISSKVDSSGGSIGRRYARTDQIGIPFAVTIDYDTIKDGTVTLRERDTCDQIRIPISELADVVRDLSVGNLVWTQVCEKYPKQPIKE